MVLHVSVILFTVGGGIPACIAGGMPACLAAGLQKGGVVFQHALQVVSQHALQQVSEGGVVSQHALQQVSRRGVKAHTQGEVEGSGLGGLQVHTQEGGIPACTEADTPQDGYCCGRYASYWNAFLLAVYFYFVAAMSFAHEDQETLYRKSLNDVAKMLKSKHGENYMV